MGSQQVERSAAQWQVASGGSDVAVDLVLGSNTKGECLRGVEAVKFKAVSKTQRRFDGAVVVLEVQTEQGVSVVVIRRISKDGPLSEQVRARHSVVYQLSKTQRALTICSRQVQLVAAGLENTCVKRV